MSYDEEGYSVQKTAVLAGLAFLAFLSLMVVIVLGIVTANHAEVKKNTDNQHTLATCIQQQGRSVADCRALIR